MQYLAPIIKNRQYNFLPFGVNPFVNAQARPNEVTYSEDWLRPDYRPPPPATSAAARPPPARRGQRAARRHRRRPKRRGATNPADGLRGLMVPPGGGR